MYSRPCLTFSHTCRDLQGIQGEQMDVGLPSTLLLPILNSIRKNVQEIRDILSTIELRLVGSSLLLIYEGERDRTEMGVQWLARQQISTTGDKGQLTEEEKYEDADIEGDDGDVQDAEGEEEEEEEDSSEEDSEDGRSRSPCAVRLIDFAHTRLKRGQGPDSGVLKGLETVLNLLDKRIASLKSNV
jgi:inositol-polyphosphate multikinase